VRDWLTAPRISHHLVPRHHFARQLGQAPIAAEGGADRRSAKNADAPINQSREAHHSARPHQSPEGATGRELGPALLQRSALS